MTACKLHPIPSPREVPCFHRSHPQVRRHLVIHSRTFQERMRPAIHLHQRQLRLRNQPTSLRKPSPSSHFSGQRPPLRSLWMERSQRPAIHLRTCQLQPAALTCLPQRQRQRSKLLRSPQRLRNLLVLFSGRPPVLSPRGLLAIYLRPNQRQKNQRRVIHLRTCQRRLGSKVL